MNWYVVLQLDQKGRVRVQPDWRNRMKVGDRVKFLSPDGMVEVRFKPAPAKDIKGRLVDGLNPFGKGKTRIDGSKEFYAIKHSCKSSMACFLVDHKGVLHDYDGPALNRLGREPEEGDRRGGSNPCTGGSGDNSVKCPPH